MGKTSLVNGTCERASNSTGNPISRAPPYSRTISGPLRWVQIAPSSVIYCDTSI
jgi:hypothetical protein